TVVPTKASALMSAAFSSLSVERSTAPVCVWSVVAAVPPAASSAGAWAVSSVASASSAGASAELSAGGVVAAGGVVGACAVLSAGGVSMPPVPAPPAPVSLAAIGGSGS